MDPGQAMKALADYPSAVAISALTGEGIPEMLEKAHTYLYEDFIAMQIFLPYQAGGLVSLFQEQGQVDKLEQVSGGVEIRGRIPGRLLSYFRAFQKNSQ